MNKTFALMALLALPLTFGSPAFASTGRADFLLEHNLVDGPQLFGDSGVPYVRYAEMEKSLTDLAARFPDRARLAHYGTTVGGRNLNVLRIEDSKSGHLEPGRPAVEISGAIHGNEFLGIEDKLATYFLEHTDRLPGLSLYLAAGGVVYVIPVVNPDGYEARDRGNHRGVDLNRDFDILPTSVTRFTQPETQALARYLNAEISSAQLKLRFAMDYHCCVPALISPWTYIDAQPSQKDLAAYNEVIDEQKRLLGYEAGNAAQTVGYLAEGSSLDYFYAKFGTIAFTIEGKYRGEVGKFDQHAQLLDSVFQKLALKQLGIL